MSAESDPDYVYVIYIKASREKVWAALTDREERAWWANTRHDTTFEKNAPLAFRRNGRVDVRGVIKEIDPPKKLVYTFRSEGPGPQHDEGDSLVTYDLAEDGDATKLTVLHTGFVKNSNLRNAISGGWPSVLSSLKTMLESGGRDNYTFGAMRKSA
jgi:uncharacterized protein YndB with AHSA1/START domain